MRLLILSKESTPFESDALYTFIRAVTEAGDEIVLRSVAANADIAARLQDAATFDRCVVAGDDQVIAATLFALRGLSVPILVFPDGLENLYFESLGNSHEPAALAKACREGHTVSADLGLISWSDPQGTIHTHPFSCMVGFGFDATLLRTAIPNKEALGGLSYILAALSINKIPRATFDITLDNNRFTVDGIACLVANSPMLGADIEIVSGSSITDGTLDIVVVQATDSMRLIRPVFAGVLDHKGTNLGRPEMAHYQGVSATVQSSEALPLQVNGEPTPYEVNGYKARILPGANQLIVDHVSPYAAASSHDASERGNR